MVIVPVINYIKRYTHEFQSINGNDCLLEIYKFSNDKIPDQEMTGQSINLRIVFGDNTASFFDSIRTKTLILDIWAEKEGDYNDLCTADFYDFYCKFWINNILEFQGWIQPDINNQSFTCPPYQLSIKFGCGLFLLKDNKIDCPFYYGSIRSIIQQGLDFNAFNLDIIDACNIFEESFLSLAGDDQKATLNHLIVPFEPLYEKTYYEAINEILQSLCCEIYQHEGQWLIKRNDINDTTINAVVYDYTGILTGTTTIQFNKNINTPSTSPASRICWINNEQMLDYEVAPRKLIVEAPKILSDNFFVNGNDFASDCEFNNPDDEYPTAADLEYFDTWDTLTGSTLKNSYRYLSKKYLDSDSYAVAVNGLSWRYHYEDDNKLNIKVVTTGYINNEGKNEPCIYVASTNTFFYAVAGASFSNNRAITFDTSFGLVVAGKIYYAYNVSVSGLGVTFKISYNKNAFNPLGAISTEDKDVFGCNISPVHVSLICNLLKNFSTTGQWTLGNDGNWYTLYATSGNKLTVDLAIDIKDVAKISTNLKEVELEFLSDGIIPDSGYLFYRAQGINYEGVFQAFYKSIQFTLKHYSTYGALTVIKPYIEDVTTETEIAPNNKETFTYNLLFTDTPDIINPHLVYKNWISAVSTINKTEAWNLDINDSFDYSHYELIKIILQRQLSSRRAVLTGTIASKLMLIGRTLLESNYNNAKFKNIFCTFTPKLETYLGTWVEMYNVFGFDPVSYSAFDESFEEQSFD